LFSQALISQGPVGSVAEELPNFNLSVAYDICRTLASKPFGSTMLFQRAQLHISYQSFKAYLGFLQRCGLVEACLVPARVPWGRGLVVLQPGRRQVFARRAYQVTEKGGLFVSVLDEAYAMVRDV